MSIKEMESFLRIANARMRGKYPFKSQRNAVVAKMYVNWLDRKNKNE